MIIIMGVGDISLMFNNLNRIKLYKEGDVIYTSCPFCDGYIPVDFEPLYDSSEVKIKGKCKKCTSYIQVRTDRSNFITMWIQ